MIQSILHAAARLDRWLQGRLGRPYRVMLTVGLAVEAGHRLKEISERYGSLHEVAALALFLLLNLALLVHQLAELQERVGRRGAAGEG